jgi:hypothetical protein
MPVSSSSMPRTADLYAAQKKIKHLEETRSRGIGNPEEQAEQDKLLKKAVQEKEKQRTLNVQLLFAILIVITLVMAFARAFPEAGSPLQALFWLFAVPPIIPKAAGAAADFASLLAPLLAISVAIERLLETAFNWFEQSSRAVADVLVAPKEALDWVGREYQEAYDATDQAAATLATDMTPDSLELLNMAEDRLAKAEDRLRNWVNAPEYIAWKKALSIWIGLLAGLVISVIGDLGMLHYMEIPAPRLIDMVVTGLIIGSGPGPMHDLIGILQSGKDALGSVADLAKGKAVRQAVEEIRSSEAMRKRDEA